MTLREDSWAAAKAIGRIADEAHKHKGCVTNAEIADAIESVAKAFAELALRKHCEMRGVHEPDEAWIAEAIRAAAEADDV